MTQSVEQISRHFDDNVSIFMNFLVGQRDFSFQVGSINKNERKLIRKQNKLARCTHKM